MKVGPVHVARFSASIGVAGFSVGHSRLTTISGKPSGWLLYARARPLNRSLTWRCDLPTVSRWRW